MNKTMLSLSLAGACALMACNANPFGGVVPSKGQVRLNVPGASEEGAQALLAGSQSEFYVSSLNIANSVNGGVGLIFRIVDEISALPPTETDNETFAVWGPSEPRGLERNSFRFTVNKVDESFEYKLEARAKDKTAEEDFVVAFEGVAFPDDDDKGHGSLDVHWGALRSLDDTQCLIGDLHVDYAADVEPRRLDVTFRSGRRRLPRRGPDRRDLPIPRGRRCFGAARLRVPRQPAQARRGQARARGLLRAQPLAGRWAGPLGRPPL